MRTSRSHLFENRYCNGCSCTTRHEKRIESCICLRCGVTKYPVQKPKKQAATFAA